MNESNYTQIIDAKDGNKIPEKNQIAFHSKYNPIREAQSFANQLAESNFFIILGVCGGYHIEEILTKYPAAKILAVEENEKDFEFLKEIPCVKKLSQNPKVLFCTLKNLGEKVLNNYKPAIDGNISITSLRQWESSFAQTAETARKIIQDALKILAADFSVQSHFGKIWQKNIFENLKTASELKINTNEILKKIHTEKCAAIIAAGPSLDESIQELVKNRNKYYVIATDTAFQVLIKNDIKTDAVISVDGQLVSYAHYFFETAKKNPAEDTLFIFDLCANPSAVRRIQKSTKNIIFAETGHPLSQYASKFSGQPSFIHLDAGSGTVTIAAASFADAVGFSKIKLYGADFSYLNGKPYAKGTYLDSLYRKSENRFSNSETMYDRLLYRTELKILSENVFTTEILESYKKSLDNFLLEKRFFKNMEIFEKSEIKKIDFFSEFNYKRFLDIYIASLKKAFKEQNSQTAEDYTNQAFTTLLPLCAWFENKLNSGALIPHRNSVVGNSVILAYNKTLDYTRLYYET